MAIRIEHRFIKRLLPPEHTKTINYIIVGTFNPAPPIFNLLTIQERKAFAKIEESKSYIRLSQVKNFYDRPQNRFWKVMDLIHNADFYAKGNLRAKNTNGLKYYKGMDRDKVFQSQTGFCNELGVFITDLVRVIEPASFEDIYNGFPDKGIERAKCEWNTEGISKVICRYNPKKVLVNLKSNMKSIPNISEQIELLKKKHTDKVFHVASTSGNAGFTYSDLHQNWKQHFK